MAVSGEIDFWSLWTVPVDIDKDNATGTKRKAALFGRKHCLVLSLDKNGSFSDRNTFEEALRREAIFELNQKQITNEADLIR